MCKYEQEIRKTARASRDNITYRDIIIMIIVCNKVECRGPKFAWHPSPTLFGLTEVGQKAENCRRNSGTPIQVLTGPDVA